ncbi:MAG: acyl-CoA carboxylase subunit epsilon [Kibdelosporangium sp.]
MTPADLIVLKGRPDDEEIAALIAVLTALNAKAVAAADKDSGPAGGLWATGPGRPAYRPPGAWTRLRSGRAA